MQETLSVICFANASSPFGRGGAALAATERVKQKERFRFGNALKVYYVIMPWR